MTALGRYPLIRSLPLYGAVAGGLLAALTPHLAEGIQAMLRPEMPPGAAALVAELPWPEADPTLVAADAVTIAVQVGGKLRATLTMPPDSPADEVIARAAADPAVARLLEGKRVVKRVHVPNRIVNFVVAG